MMMTMTTRHLVPLLALLLAAPASAGDIREL
jgi:hypothetical protein